jgi:hypothetical protein
MPNFAIEHLSTRQLSEAWPILHATRAVPVAVWWENEAKDLIRRGGGVLVARTADGSIHGLATYESVDRPHEGRLLEVGKLIAFELNRKEPVRHALCEALDSLALAGGLDAVALPLSAQVTPDIRRRA